jgi:hypothetical protein
MTKKEKAEQVDALARALSASQSDALRRIVRAEYVAREFFHAWNVPRRTRKALLNRDLITIYENAVNTTPLGHLVSLLVTELNLSRRNAELDAQTRKGTVWR